MKRVLSCVAGCAVTVSTLVAVSSVTHQAAAFTPTVKPQAQTISVLQGHTLVLGGDGAVYGTGTNDEGELPGTALKGKLTTLTRLAALPLGVRGTAVATGIDFSLVLGSDGRVYGAGGNPSGEITGDDLGPVNTWRPLVGLPAAVRAVKIAAASGHSLVLGSDGRVYGCGDNSSHALTGNQPDVRRLTPLSGLPAGVRAAALAAGEVSSVVLGSDGRAYGTGSNRDGQLSLPADQPFVLTLSPFRNVPVRVIAVAAGDRNTVLLGADRRAYVTGNNQSGQLGLGVADLNAHPVAVRLPDVPDVVAVGAGDFYVLVVDAFGAVYGTGTNGHGQLTTAVNPVTKPAPLRLAPGQPTTGRIVEVGAGRDTVLVRDVNGIVLGAGLNTHSELTGPSQDDVTELRLLSGLRVAPYVRPSITGVSQVGFTLRARPGAWSVVPTRFAFRWLRDGRPIPFATSSSYRLNRFDRGHRISVRVSASRGSSFVPGTLTSLPTRPVR